MSDRLRDKLRGGAHPIRRQLRAAAVLHVLPEPPTLRLEVPSSVACRAPGVIRVDLPLQPQTDRVDLSCGCPQSPPSCPARLAAVDRAGVRIQRIGWDPDGIKIQLPDNSWQYNYEYVYLPYTDTPPAIRWPGEEQWTQIRGHWWFHRTHDD